jgi:hypothetical protein
MSMIGNLRTTSDADIDALLAKPKRIELMLYGEYIADKSNNGGIFSFFKKKREEPADNWKPAEPGAEFDIDKAWHGIHFLLTGSAWEGNGPEAFIVAGGTEIGDVDVGYGPARAFKAKGVHEIAERLKSVDKKSLEDRCDKKAFIENEIYPEIWDEAPEDCFGYLLEYFEMLKQFICKAAEDKKALIVYIN